MGMTYGNDSHPPHKNQTPSLRLLTRLADELSTFGILRKQFKLGPYGMFQRLLHDWKDTRTPREVAEKVKRSVAFPLLQRAEVLS